MVEDEWYFLFTPLKASTQTELPNCYELKDVTTQTDETTSMDLTDGPVRNYEEDLAVQMIITDTSKERYETTTVEANKLKGTSNKNGSRTTTIAPRPNDPAPGDRKKRIAALKNAQAKASEEIVSLNKELLELQAHASQYRPAQVGPNREEAILISELSSRTENKRDHGTRKSNTISI